MVRGLPTEHQRSRTPITKTPRAPRRPSPAPPAHQPNRPARFAPCSGPRFAPAKSRPTCNSVSSNSGRTARAGSSTSPPRHGSPAPRVPRARPPRTIRTRVRRPVPRRRLAAAARLTPPVRRARPHGPPLRPAATAGRSGGTRAAWFFTGARAGGANPHPEPEQSESAFAEGPGAACGSGNEKSLGPENFSHPTSEPFSGKVRCVAPRPLPHSVKIRPPPHGTAARPGEPRLPSDHARARKSGSSPRSLPDRSQPDRFLPAAATAR